MITQVLASEITNPALPTEIASKAPGAGLAFYLASLWRAVVTVGGLLFLLYLVWGGIEWMTAAGDKAKVENAQHKITNSVLGLAVLVGSYALTLFIQGVFKINLLQPVFQSNITP
ncbi:MAG TPA: hypothetical protein VF837_02645 [Patescibacteria group bacterium]